MKCDRARHLAVVPKRPDVEGARAVAERNHMGAILDLLNWIDYLERLPGIEAGSYPYDAGSDE